jgi:hypothetical protein
VIGAIAAVVSAAVTLLIQALLLKRVEHRFARQLEEYKSTLAARLSAEQGVVTRRFEAFPKIVELCYRTRNMARDILKLPTSSALVEELRARARELEDDVFRFRIDLEADHVFGIVHRYKNMVIQFGREAADTHGTVVPAALHLLFAEIDKAYASVVQRLSEDATHAHATGG